MEPKPTTYVVEARDMLREACWIREFKPFTTYTPTELVTCLVGTGSIPTDLPDSYDDFIEDIRARGIYLSRNEEGWVCQFLEYELSRFDLLVRNRLRPHVPDIDSKDWEFSGWLNYGAIRITLY
jgi:hypothetical protein